MKKFVRKLDKNEIPVCNILGVDIAAINMEWLLKYLDKNMKCLKGDYICVSNVHTTVTSYENSEYRNIQNSGIMAIPDGGPLSTIGRKRGFQDMERTPGPTLMKELFEHADIYKFTHYFYGSTNDTLTKMKKKLKEKYPDLKIVGTYSPPFRPLTKQEDEEIIYNINKSNADIVWIGLGAPKQENWMYEHQGKINSLMIGVGAGFDYFAENIKRAPKWMQQTNLEWVYRLMQDPKRLFKRYIDTNTKFMWYIRNEK